MCPSIGAQGRHAHAIARPTACDEGYAFADVRAEIAATASVAHGELRAAERALGA